MTLRAGDKRWSSTFARFVSEYGVTRLAALLSVDPSAVYHWISGSTIPHPAKAFEIQRLAASRGVALSLDEIYQHFRDARAERFISPGAK